jgi:hypothetical protein
MPSGDAQRVWFPEMIEELTSAWSASMTWEELAEFCQRMTEKRRAIRQSRGIVAPRTRCPKCGAVSRGEIIGVSVRSTLFMLKKLGIVSEDELKALERSWKKHRDAAGVDAYGRSSSTPNAGSDESGSCSC